MSLKQQMDEYYPCLQQNREVKYWLDIHNAGVRNPLNLILHPMIGNTFTPKCREYCNLAEECEKLWERSCL